MDDHLFAIDAMVPLGQEMLQGKVHLSHRKHQKIHLGGLGEKPLNYDDKFLPLPVARSKF